VSPANGYEGERVVSNPILRNNRVIFTTLIPETDACSFGGTSWLMELDALSGARLAINVFDLNGDGVFDSKDEALIALADGESVQHSVGGVQSSVGITPEPGILASPKAEYKYSPGTEGVIGVTAENPGASAYGRQSWRQLR
jgi:type IV pilus assembly protein PilY1